MRSLMRLSGLIAILVSSGCRSPQAPVQETVAVAEPQNLPPGSPPDTILVKSRYGEVTFTHKKHYDRVGGNCGACHPKLFPQSLAPLKYGKALHRAAEADRTSCAYCHAVGGSSFAADSNCIKCHAERDYSRP